ncbi:MAG: hypothetical protein M0Z96_05875 [Actinomycetota bacterium]|nr:hypothetical protein [Actinomycetota bacterium]
MAVKGWLSLSLLGIGNSNKGFGRLLSDSRPRQAELLADLSGVIAGEDAVGGSTSSSTVQWMRLLSNPGDPSLCFSPVEVITP